MINLKLFIYCFDWECHMHLSYSCIVSPCRFLMLCTDCNCLGLGTRILFCTSLRANSHPGICWRLFSCWFSYGKFLQQEIYAINLIYWFWYCFNFYWFQWIVLFTGNERKSSWNCTQIDLFWCKPVSVPANLGLCCNCGRLCCYTN